MGKTNIEAIRIGDLYLKRIIHINSEFPGYNDNDNMEIGIWDGDSTEINLKDLREIRTFINETIMKMTFKTTTK